MGEVESVSALLKLHRPNRHDLATLLTQRGHTAITYKGRPRAYMIYQGFFSFPVCPGGCKHEVVGIPAELAAKLRELADDPDHDEDTYTPRFLDQPRETGD